MLTVYAQPPLKPYMFHLLPISVMRFIQKTSMEPVAIQPLVFYGWSGYEHVLLNAGIVGSNTRFDP